MPSPPQYSYWTVSLGGYSYMAESMVDSARRCGVTEDFNVWSDRNIPGAITHNISTLNPEGWIFKLEYLEREVSNLNYDFFVWLDSDNYFVRHPGSMKSILRDSPVHITLETETSLIKNIRPHWWGCPLDEFPAYMKSLGLTREPLFNCNGGFFIVHRDAIQEFCSLCWKCLSFWKEKGFILCDEPLLAYAMQIMCKNLNDHTLEKTARVWATDWKGHFLNQIPDGNPWIFTDFLNAEKITVNPAIVHAIHSKKILSKGHFQGLLRLGDIDAPE